MRFKEFTISGSIIGILSVLALVMSAAPVSGQDKTPLAEYKSTHFLIRSDMPAEDAEELLQKAEAMLRGVSSYWGVPHRRVIECNVVDEISNWRGRGFAESSLQHTENGGGITLSQVSRRGGRTFTQSVVWAAARTDTMLHESVHAYCSMNFGTTGPTWYSEGMAEIGHFWKEDDSTVNAPRYITRFLNTASPPTLADLTDRKQKTGDSKEKYAWRWAFCYMMANNPNYAERFRVLGLGLLTKQRSASFRRIFGSVLEEVDFEFHFFLKHVGRGFDAGLTAWNWKAKFKAVKGEGTVTSKIVAKGGWQPSLLQVKEGQVYGYTAEGEWSTTAGKEWLTADGANKQSGQLVGTILQDGELLGAISLGTTGTFTAPHSGNLYLRCKDKWTALGDNDGTLEVTLRNSSASEKSDIGDGERNSD